MSVQISAQDVFLSYSITEGRTAELVRLAFSEAGLDVFDTAACESGSHSEDILRQALAKAAAVIVIVDVQRAPASTTMVELGAAIAWRKPIYVVYADTDVVKLPSYLQNYHAYPISRIDDLVRAVKHPQGSLSRLSEEDREVLRSVYVDMGVSVDKLAVNPGLLDQFSADFNARRGSDIPGERLMQELFNLRKRGGKSGLPRLRK